MNRSIAMLRTRLCGSCIYCRLVSSWVIWEVKVSSKELLNVYMLYTNREQRSSGLSIKSGPCEPIPYKEEQQRSGIGKEWPQKGMLHILYVSTTLDLTAGCLIRLLWRLFQSVKFPCSPALLQGPTDTLICHSSQGLEFGAWGGLPLPFLLPSGSRSYSMTY